MQTEASLYQTIDYNKKDNVNEDYLSSVALSLDNIIGARCVKYEQTYIIALLTQPIYLKSERDRCLDNVKNTLQQLTDNRIIATFDIDIYSRINENLSEEQKAELYKKATARL